jgi:protein phosphatase
VISSQHPHLKIGALSHPGEKRDINEDNHLVSSFRQEKKKERILIAIVADGIGGHQAGEVASEITVETIIERIKKEGPENPIASMRSAINEAATSVFGAAQQSADFYGMGSTVAIAFVIGNKLFTSHVGDSRIYLQRKGKFRQITKDHTWVQEAIEHQIIDESEAQDHPRAHMLQRAIGSPDPPEADFRLRLTDRESDAQSEKNQGLHLKPGDRLLLCTDGLTDLVKDNEIELALLEQSPKEAAQALVSLARARGGHDNITVVILEVPTEWPYETSFLPRRLFFLSTILILSFLAVIAIAMLASWKLGWIPWPLGGGPTPTAPSPGDEASLLIPFIISLLT